MAKAQLPANERERLALIKELEILDSQREQEYDDLTYLASHICGTPIALISIIDADRQWFKSAKGIDAQQTPREFAFCAHAIHDQNILYVPDSEKDPRFFDNPLVAGPPHVKFYAGYPLDLGEERRIGTLCVIDDHPRELTKEQLYALEVLGKQAIALFRLRLVVKRLQKARNKERGITNMLNHELRNPLTSILGYLSMLNPTNLEEFPKVVEACSRNARRMLRIVDDFLLFSQLEESEIQLDIREGSINQAIRESIQLMGGLLTKKRVRVELSLDETLPMVRFDQQRTIQVIDNFISNACKYAHEGERIHIISLQESGCVRIDVRDFGPGIGEEQLQTLFTPFSKGGSTTSSSGLGLSIAKELIELQGGKVGVASQVGEGTTFFFTLPI